MAASYGISSAYDIAACLMASIVAEASWQSMTAEKLIPETPKNDQDNCTEEVARRVAWYAALKNCTPSYFEAEVQATMPPKPAGETTSKSNKVGWGIGILDSRLWEDSRFLR